MNPYFKKAAFLGALLLALAAFPGQARESWYSLYDQALEHISLGRWDQAVTCLEEATTIKPLPELHARTYGVWRKDYLPYYYLGVAHYNLGHYDLAQECFNRSLSYGVIKQIAGEHEALLGYQKTIEEKKAASQQELSTRIAEEFAKGLELEREDKLREALVKFESVLTLDPRNQEAAGHVERIRKEIARREDLAKLDIQIREALDQGKAHLAAGRLEEALLSFENVLKLNPEHKEALGLRAQAEDSLKKRKQEQERISGLVAEKIGLGEALFQQGSLSQALTQFQQVLELSPDNVEAAGYVDRIKTSLEHRQLIEHQNQMLAEAAALIAEDSLISARTKLILAAQLGPSGTADSLLALVDSSLAQRELSRKQRDLPQIVLTGMPDSSFRVKTAWVRLSGTALDGDGISRIVAVVNGLEETIFQAPGDSASPLQASFERKLRMQEGMNLVELLVFDSHSNTRTVIRAIEYLPPLWRRTYFLAGVIAFLLLGGGGLYYHKRSLIQSQLNRFRRRPFEVIEPNPFIVGNPIRSREMFFGREDDFRFVKSKVDNERYGSLIVLFGERRTGKTSVLYQILNERLGSQYLPIFVDMQAMAINDDSEFLGRLAEITSAALSRLEMEIDISVFEDKTKNPYPLFDKFIDSLLRAIGQKRVLFLFDEYELIEEKVEEGKISKDIFLFLSGLVEHKAGLFLIFAGNHRLQESKKNYWEPLLQRCDYRNIGYLSDNDTRRLIQEPVYGKVFYLGGAIRKIMELTGGQPFYTQLVCRNIVEILNVERRNYFSEEDIPLIMRDILDNPPPQMIYFWAGLSIQEKLCLASLAELAKGSRAPGLGELLNLLQKYSAPITDKQLKEACERMVRREVLVQASGDCYRFRMDISRQWIREEHNLYKVFQEIEHAIGV